MNGILPGCKVSTYGILTCRNNIFVIEMIATVQVDDIEIEYGNQNEIMDDMSSMGTNNEYSITYTLNIIGNYPLLENDTEKRKEFVSFIANIFKYGISLQKVIKKTNSEKLILTDIPKSVNPIDLTLIPKLESLKLITYTYKDVKQMNLKKYNFEGYGLVMNQSHLENMCKSFNLSVFSKKEKLIITKIYCNSNTMDLKILSLGECDEVLAFEYQYINNTKRKLDMNQDEDQTNKNKNKTIKNQQKKTKQ